MQKDDIVQGIGLGAAAGLIGTAAALAVKTVRKSAASEPSAHGRGANSIREDYREHIPQAVASGLRSITNSGSAVAALYTAIREEPKVLRNGLLLGVGIWGIAKLGWLPGAHGHPRTGKFSLLELTQHVVFAVSIAAAYRSLQADLDQKRAS